MCAFKAEPMALPEYSRIKRFHDSERSFSPSPIAAFFFRQRENGRMSIQEYLEKHRLSRKIENAVNAAVSAKTPDPILYISNHMKKAVPTMIRKIVARQIFDSRGNPTVEVDLHTNKGLFRAAVASGDSSGM